MEAVQSPVHGLQRGNMDKRNNGSAGSQTSCGISRFRYNWNEVLLVAIYPLLTVLYISIVFHLYRIRVITSSLSFALVQHLTTAFTSLILGEGCKEFSNALHIDGFFVDVFRFTDLMWGSVLRALAAFFFNATLANVATMSGIPATISLTIVLFYMVLYLANRRCCSPMRCVALIAILAGFVIQCFDGKTLEHGAPLAAVLFACSFSLHEVTVTSALEIFGGEGEKQLNDHEVFTGILLMTPIAAFLGYTSFSWPFVYVMFPDPGITWFDGISRASSILLVGVLNFILSLLRLKLLDKIGGAYWQVIDLIAPFILFILGFYPAAPGHVTFLCVIAFTLVITGRILNAIDFTTEFFNVKTAVENSLRRQVIQDVMVEKETLRIAPDDPNLNVKPIGILHSTGKLELFDPLA